METITCISCGTTAPVDSELLCEATRCQSRDGYKYNWDRMHKTAVQEDLIRMALRVDETPLTIDMALAHWAHTAQMRDEAREPITRWDDRRLYAMVERLWDSLSGSIDRDDIWEIFVDELGMPDKRSRTYDVTLNLTVTVEVEAVDEDEAIEKAYDKIEEEYYSISDLIAEGDLEAREQ